MGLTKFEALQILGLEEGGYADMTATSSIPKLTTWPLLAVRLNTCRLYGKGNQGQFQEIGTEMASR